MTTQNQAIDHQINKPFIQKISKSSKMIFATISLLALTGCYGKFGNYSSESEGWKHGKGKGTMMLSMFNYVDENKDEKVSKPEITQYLNSMFSQSDADSNSSLSPKEIIAHIQKVSKDLGLSSGKMRDHDHDDDYDHKSEHDHDRMDYDKDTKKKKEKYSKRKHHRSMKNFWKSKGGKSRDMAYFILYLLDDDADGQVSSDEYNKFTTDMMSKYFDHMDKNSDSFIELKEMKRMRH